jgi:chromosome transmission fidelity protein 8
MPSIPLHLTPTEGTQNLNGSPDPLPQLLQTPSGLALLEIQGTINMPTPEPSSHEHDTGGKTSIGRLVFPDYVKDDPTGSKSWMKRVYLYVGRHQRLTGEVKKLVNPVAVIRKRIGDDIDDGGIEDLEIVEVVYYKVLFSSRPEPVSSD